jgi:hypothetical protein
MLPGLFLIVFGVEYATERVGRNAIAYLPFCFPVGFIIPLCRAPSTHQLPAIDLKENPIGESSTVEEADTLIVWIPLTARARTRAVKVLALGLDVWMGVIVKATPPRWRAILTACAENIWPGYTRQCRIPGYIAEWDTVCFLGLY